MKGVNKLIVFLGLAVLTILGPSAASAELLLVTEGASYQQTTNNPCVIGDTSCKQGGFIYTYFTGTPDWDMPSGTTTKGVYDVTSPVDFMAGNLGAKGTFTGEGPYTVVSGANTPVTAPDGIPSQFLIGIDINYAGNATNSDNFEQLVYFKTFIYNDITHIWELSQENSYIPTLEDGITPNPTALAAHNGNGYSDAVLSGFVLPMGAKVYFQAKMTNDSDGMEQFFIIPGSTPNVPIPGSLLLLAPGLAGLVAWRRKVRK
jgi:hypothetical protein